MLILIFTGENSRIIIFFFAIRKFKKILNLIFSYKKINVDTLLQKERKNTLK